jgi:hypothetical protein
MKPNPQVNAETFPEDARIQCRYLRVKDVLAGYPLKMTRLYELMNSGRVKSFVLKDRGNVRGIRLIDKDSLDFFFERSALEAEEEQKKATEAPNTPAQPPPEKPRSKRR